MTSLWDKESIIELVSESETKGMYKPIFITLTNKIGWHNYNQVCKCHNHPQKRTKQTNYVDNIANQSSYKPNHIIWPSWHLNPIVWCFSKSYCNSICFSGPRSPPFFVSFFWLCFLLSVQLAICSETHSNSKKVLAHI